MSDRIRTTISLSPEAYEVFKRMADAGNLSVSRCMGDWLADTKDAAAMITLKMEDAKKAPMLVVKEMRAMVAGMVLTAGDADAQARETRRMQGAQQRAAGASPAPPPSSNTGVLVPPLTAKGSVLRRSPKGRAA
jgi:hypothetical protein